jgi:hypothetical protein
MRVSANDYLSVEIFEAAYAAQEQMRLLLIRLIQRYVIIVKPDTSLHIKTIPFPALINIIENNIETLTSGGYTPSNMEPTVQWLGERFDIRNLNHTDVNRWFISMEQLEQLLYSIAYRGLITGNFTPNTSYGQFRTRQIIRTVTN